MLLLCMIGVSTKTFADENSLRVGKVEIAQGISNVSMPIYLDNSVSMCGFEVFIELPEGISLKHEYDEDEEEYVWGITKGGRLRTEHGVNCAVDNNGYIHLLCADLVTNKNFYDSDSKKGLPLVMLELNVDPSLEIGSYDVVLHNVLLNHNENPTIVEYTPDDVACSLFVKPTSGIYTNVHDGKLDVLSAIGEEISATDFVGAVSSYQNVTCIDVTGVNFDAKYSTSDIMGLNISRNAFVIVGEENQLVGNNIIYGDECANLVLTDGYDFSAPKEFTAATVTYNAVVSPSLGYKTLVLPYDCAVPAGFEGYEVGSVNDGVLDMVPVNTITANKPVILKNEGTATLKANNAVITPADGALTDGVLVGTYEAIDAPVGSYVLQNQGGNVAFYHVTEAVQPVVNAFRAYLSVPSNTARIRVMFDGEATVIRQIENGELKAENHDYYNLNGQRISKFSKGIVINNGHKIVK